MADILSQAEIEALLASLTGDSDTKPEIAFADDAASESPAIAPAPAPELPTTTIKRSLAESYDFRRPDKFAKDQLRTLHILHETFARLFASSLAAYLRVPVHVELISVQQLRYDEYMRTLTNSILTVFNLPPLVGQAILEIDFNLLLALIDRLLGGPGSMVKKTSALTDIEKALAESILNRALKEFCSAWEGITPLTAEREMMETQSQFIQIAPPNDVVASLVFEIKVGDMHGAMSLCMPYTLLKPILSKLSIQRWSASGSAQTNLGDNAAVLVRSLENTEVTCAVRLGSAALSLDDLMRLSIGDVVMLDRRQEEDVDVMIGSNVKFRGKPGLRGKKLAVYIRQILSDSKPVERPDSARRIA